MTMRADSPPLCERADQLPRLDGQRVRLIGVYQPIATLRKMTRPGAPRDEVDLGEVVVVIEGSASDYDPSAPAGEPARIALGTDFRPREEIERLRERKVCVEGRLVVAPRAASAGAARKPAPALLDPLEPELEQ